MGKVLDKVKQCESIIHYEFKEKRQGVDALFAYTGNCQELGALVVVKKNDGLGILGDIVLQNHLCRKWLNLGLSKKDWTQIRQEAASNANLAIIGKSRGLDACVILNPGETTVQDSVMATTVEAIIGAVDLDGGMAAAEKVMEQLGLSHELLKSVLPDMEVLGGLGAPPPGAAQHAEGVREVQCAVHSLYLHYISMG